MPRKIGLSPVALMRMRASLPDSKSQLGPSLATSRLSVASAYELVANACAEVVK